MKIIFKLKAGATFAPALIIIFYILFVGLDLFTTYIASPDLEREGNIIIRHLKLNWSQIIVSVAFITIILSALFVLATNYTHKFFQVDINNGNPLLAKSIIFNKKMLLSFSILGIFYSHLFCSIFLTINNYLSYIYLFRVESSLRNISIFYLTIETKLIPYFFYYMYSFFIVMAFIYVWYKLRSIRNKYMSFTA